MDPDFRFKPEGITNPEDPRMTGEAPVAGSASTHNRKRRDTVDRQIIDLERALYTSSSPGREDEIEAKLSQLYAERENLGPSTLEHNVGAIGDTLGAIPGQVESGVEAVMQPIASGLTSTARFIRDMKPAIEGAVGGAFSGAQGAFGPGSGVNRILGDAGRPANNELRSAGDAALSEPGRQARREQVETPLTFADPATVSSYAPTDNQVAPREVHQYLTQTHGMSDNHAAGMLANIQQESSFNAGAYNPNDVGMPSGGFFQHRADRLEGLTGAAGDWSQNWQGQIDFALSEPAGKRYLQMDFATPEDAAEWFVRHFEIPGKMEEQVDIRRGHVKRFSQFGA